MLVNFDEVATGALVNAIAVVGRQVGKAVAGRRAAGEDLAAARWFETFRLTGAPPDLPGLSAAAAERLAEVLGGDEIQAALQQLLAVRLTDAPETDASRARDALQMAVGVAAPDAAAFGAALAGYYDDQVCALVARLEGEEPPLLAQIRSEAFSARQLTVLQAIERHTAALAEGESQAGGGQVPSGTPAGRLLAGVIDPFDLEVHRAVQAGDAPPGLLPALPAYVPREHDRDLAQLARAAAGGTSGMAVLVGGSSAGKTRACWEALALLRDQDPPWRLWHPIDPSRPEAALRELPAIGPRTVAWLNEAQLYLDVAAGGLGERVAAGLRQLLRDPARGPVLVLATLWPEFWDRLTARAPAGEEDPHAQARELLTGRDITVPAAFTPAQVQQLATAGDPRLALAAAAAGDGQVTQFLAGVPELMARYRNAAPAAAALITAAIDARRLGMGIAVPLAFLEAAAPGYLTDADWDGLGEDWLEQGLASTATPARGIRGPLARIRPRAGSATPAPGPGPAYRLADYLEQHGRRARRAHIPPAGFWTAAARFAALSDLAALARAASNRGLYRDAARLRKHATAHGDTNEAAVLIQWWHWLHPHSSDPDPARWAAAHAAIDDSFAVARLLDGLRAAGAGDQAAALADRAAAHAAIDDPRAVEDLLKALRRAGAGDQAAALADRAAAHAAIDDPRAVEDLLKALGEAGAGDQAAALADRAAARAALDNPAAVARLLVALRRAGAGDQAAVLLARDPAAHAALDDPGAVARLLDALRGAGAGDQAAVLLARDPAAHAALDDPAAVARLLDALRGAGAGDQAAVLLARDPAAHAALGNPGAVAGLLDALRGAGAGEQVAMLADRAIAHAALDDPAAVASLLTALRMAGRDEQVAVLLARDPAAHAALGDPVAVAVLLESLGWAGADEQVAVLLARHPAVVAALDDPVAVVGLLTALGRAGAGEQVAALADRRAAVGGLSTFAWLLEELRRAGADERLAVLLAWDAAAHATLDDPGLVASLLGMLRVTGADEQVAVLLARDPAARAALDDPARVAALLHALRRAGADEQAAVLLARDPAAHAALDDPDAVARLLDALRRAGADDQAAALADRAAAHAALDDPARVAALLDALSRAGAEEQAGVLLAREPAAHTSLDDPWAAADLLDALRRAGADEQAKVLVERLPAEGLFDLFRRQAGHYGRYRFGREADGTPAPSWGWDDLD